MMKSLLLIFLGWMSLNAFAETALALPRSCTDPDFSYSHRNRAIAERPDIATKTTVWGDEQRGNRRIVFSREDYCPDDRSLREYYCHPSSTYIRSSLIGCPEVQRCHDGACVDNIVELNACAEPAGGWQDGTIYVLNRDIDNCSRNDHFLIFEIVEKRNIIIDCRNHAIRLQNPYRGENGPVIFYVSNSQNITIRNCTLDGGNVEIATGVKLDRSSNSRITNSTFSNWDSTGIMTFGGDDNVIENNTFNNNRASINMDPGEDRGAVMNTISNNRSCNSVLALKCSPRRNSNRLWRRIASTIRGNENSFSQVDANCPAEWENTLYQDCP